MAHVQADNRCSSDKEIVHSLKQSAANCCESLIYAVLELLSIRKSSILSLSRLHSLRVKQRWMVQEASNTNFLDRKRDFMKKLSLSTIIDDRFVDFRNLLEEGNTRLSKAARFDSKKVIHFLSLPSSIILELRGNIFYNDFDRLIRFIKDERRIVISLLEYYQNELVFVLQRALRNFDSNDADHSSEENVLRSTLDELIEFIEEEGVTFNNEFNRAEGQFDKQLYFFHQSFYVELKEITEILLHEQRPKKMQEWESVKDNFFQAAEEGNLKEIENFIQCGADLNVLKNGWTLFEVALSNGHVECASVLFQKRDEKKAVSVKSEKVKPSPLPNRLHPKKSSEELIEQFLPRVNSSAQAAAVRSSTRSPLRRSGSFYNVLHGFAGAAANMDGLVDVAANVDLRLPLHELNRSLLNAVRQGNARDVKNLIRRGADRNYRSNGKPLLHIAYELGYVDCADLLLEE